MLRQLKISILSLIGFTLFLGGIYPLAVTAIAQLLWPRQANGSLIQRNGKVAGSSLIGQPFDNPKYFWGRLSATGPVAYNGASSSGSNLGPLNPALTKAVQDRIDALRKTNPEKNGPIPVDLVTASGSGLDPHISPAGALYQVGRIARTRELSETQVTELVNAHMQGRFMGVVGEPVVNVLQLNLALDELKK